MKPDSERPFDANEADVIEQHRPLVDAGDDDVDDDVDVPLVDADPADVLDQSVTVNFDEDEWPAGPAF